MILPESAPWPDEFKAEIMAFPNGRFDDQVDSLSQFLGWVEHNKRFRARSGRHGPSNNDGSSNMGAPEICLQ